jgi:glycosyltransferase involved in cell wall biosynthesis
MRSGDAWIAIGTRSARDLARLGADPSRIRLAPVVALPALAPAPDPDRPRDPTRFLFVGQLIERKGIEVLLQAWRGVDGELTIAGDGVLRPAVEAAAAADGRIRYAGHAAGEELEELFAWADVLVLPSLYEVWGVVVNEALDRGLVVVATDEVGAVDDLVVEGVNGLVVRARSASDLRRALQGVTEWPAARFEQAAAVSRKLLDGALDGAANGYVEACLAGIAHRRFRAAGSTRSGWPT